MNWYTSDEHYYHSNMIKYASRPFKDTSEMHRELMRKFNSVVGPEDTTYHLGDFGFFKQAPQVGATLSKLKGTHVLVLGNHDEFNPFTYERWGFRGVHTTLEMPNGWVLVHDPSKACMDRTRQFITGHLHSLPEARKNMNYFDVGVDGNDLYPYSEEQLGGLLA